MTTRPPPFAERPTFELEPSPVPREADELLQVFLAAGRRYSTARRAADLARTFFDSVAVFVPTSGMLLHLRDPATATVRSFVAASDEPVEREPRIARARLASLDVDPEGFSVVDPQTSDTCELVTVVGKDGKLLVVVAAPSGDVLDRAVKMPLLARFAEQLGDAAAELAARSEIARRHRFAESVVDRTNVPIAVVGEDGTIRLSNDSLRTGLGIPEADLGSISLLDRIDVNDRHRAMAAHARAMRGRGTVGLELRLFGTGGTEHRMLVDFEPIPATSGGVDSVLVVARDVTRVRQLEDQVTHADRLATLGQLAAGVVHELNNPLTSILVYSEYVLRKTEQRGDDADAEKLRRVLSAAERIQEFARNLVAYARAERGERELLTTSQVLDQAISFCEPLLDRKRVSLARRYEDVPSLPAVRGQLQQIFINLLTNAVHAVPEPEGAIEVAIGSQSPGWVEIRFDDNGPGVAPERREDVFRPFVTTKPSDQGTGLGLSIVRNLVERHGGMIEVRDSELGGASFVLTLPVKPASERPPPMPEPETE